MVFFNGPADVGCVTFPELKGTDLFENELFRNVLLLRGPFESSKIRTRKLISFNLCFDRKFNLDFGLNGSPNPFFSFSAQPQFPLKQTHSGSKFLIFYKKLNRSFD